MDTEVRDEERLDSADPLRTLVVDLEDLVDWTADSVKPLRARTLRDARGKRWVALGVLGLVIGVAAVAVCGRRAK
jgi:hypothetical protein